MTASNSMVERSMRLSIRSFLFGATVAGAAFAASTALAGLSVSGQPHASGASLDVRMAANDRHDRGDHRKGGDEERRGHRDRGQQQQKPQAKPQVRPQAQPRPQIQNRDAGRKHLPGRADTDRRDRSPNRQTIRPQVRPARQSTGHDNNRGRDNWRNRPGNTDNRANSRNRNDNRRNDRNRAHNNSFRGNTSQVFRQQDRIRQQRHNWSNYRQGHLPRDWNRYNHNFDRSRWQRNYRAERRYHWNNYRRPHGWYYRRWTFGQILPLLFWSQNYWINSYWNYGLDDPPYGYVWVRYGDDALLVNVQTGRILRVVYDLYY
jgi:Ni/Co efflux regulator RcnB